jgi:hypothetical protein
MEREQMRATIVLLACLAAPGAAFAMDCSTVGNQASRPVRATLLVPVSPGLATPSQLLGAQGGVLAHAYDESQSVDEVLLRLRIEGCQAVAKAMPAPTAIDPNDPSVYKPKTEFDNTPWRFDMNQNGKRMTADEFDAWMKTRGVRVARGAAPVVVPAAVVPAANGTVAPAPVVPAPAPPAAPAEPVPATEPAPPTPPPGGGNEG